MLIVNDRSRCEFAEKPGSSCCNYWGESEISQTFAVDRIKNHWAGEVKIISSPGEINPTKLGL